MAKNRNNNDNNNNINNNAILTKYFGEEALNSLNKKSAETKQDKNGNQSQIEAKLDEIIESIKKHIEDNQGTKNKK